METLLIAALLVQLRLLEPQISFTSTEECISAQNRSMDFFATRKEITIHLADSYHQFS